MSRWGVLAPSGIKPSSEATNLQVQPRKVHYNSVVDSLIVCKQFVSSGTMAQAWGRSMSSLMSFVVLGLVGGFMSLRVTEALHFEYGPMTTELYTAGVDVATYLKSDWNSLPMSGICNFSMRYSHAYLVNAFGVKGTLYTYFDQLTFECTSELLKETRPCVNIASAFSACRDLTYDSHSTLSHTWTTCEDFNFRVAYLWVPARVAQLQNQNPTSSAALPLTGHANAEELAELFLKDDNNFSNDGGRRVHTEVGAQPGILACNWKYSNLFPVAYDGVSNVLLSGQYLMSADDQYSFSMQTDCNLVLYKRGLDGQYEWNGLWATMSNISDGFEHKCALELQPNGNLVVRDDYGLPRWTSGANTTNVYQVGLTVQMDGNVVLSDMQNGLTVWHTNTTQPSTPSLIPNPLNIPIPPSLSNPCTGSSTPPGSSN